MAVSLKIKGQNHSFSTPEVMGILNVTPDSFFEGSRKQTERDITERTNQIILEGGTMIDVGACSTRPGAGEVSEEEEMQRLRFTLPIVRREQPDAILSIDTFRPEVARMCVEEFGADIINDVSEGQIPGMFQMVVRLNVPYILMSVKPSLKEMLPAFKQEIAQLQELGLNDIILDPGYGFGKSLDENYALLKEQERLKELRLPLLVGVSRKRMIWQLLGTSPEEALNGTTAVNMLALERGADILRVHDVREAVENIKIFKQIENRT